MLLNYIILCVSASIDAIGIGISYGIRNANINLISKLIIAMILFISTFFGVTIGNLISLFFSNQVLKFLGSIILLIIGTYIIYESYISVEENDKTSKSSQKNILKQRNLYTENFKNNLEKNTKNITIKETVFLAFSVSIDAFSMGIYASIDNVNIYFFPLCMMIIHMSFLFLGKFCGKYFNEKLQLSENILKIFSGVLLIFIGCVKYIF